MALNRLLSMRVGVPDPEALAGFYGEIGLGTDGSNGFGGSDAGTQVIVDHHDFRRLLEVGVGTDTEADLDDIHRRLTGLGLMPRLDHGVLSVIDPTTEVTFRVEVTEPFVAPVAPPAVIDNRPGNPTRLNLRAAAVFQQARPPRRLGHLVIGTPDMAATSSFLTDGLGFRMSDEIDGIIGFLRCSTDHHNIGLVGSPVPILQHYSWECDDLDHVGHTATSLLRADPTRQAWGIGRHFAGSNYYWYLHDPAGSFIEFYSDLDQIDDDAAWLAGRGPALDFEHIANSWGPAIPIEFIVPSDLDHLQAAWAARS